MAEVTRFYVVGGQEKHAAIKKQEWHQYRKGVILDVDSVAGKAELVFEYTSPPEACASEDDPSITFKAATLADGRMYVCTQTEVLTLDLPGFDVAGYVSLPWFNDVHHVRPTDRGTLLVVNTGLDMLVEVKPAGDAIRTWNVLGEDPWHRFSPNIDYRKVVTTKPHDSHPNHVFELGGELWVTRFKQRDAVSLSDGGRRIPIDIAGPHDGSLRGDHIYFTTVDGRVIIADANELRVTEIIDLTEIETDWDPRLALGWCRGLHVIDDRRVVIGFSRLRFTKIRSNIEWLRYRLGRVDNIGCAPTRLAMYDIRDRKLRWEIDLEKAGLNAIFSIHGLAARDPDRSEPS